MSHPCLEDYTLLKVLGKGSFGKVVLVERKGGEKPNLFAMKILRKENVVRRNQIVHTKTEREVLSVCDHPFIVKLHFAFQTPKKLHLVLEFCAGGELFYHLSRAGRFNEGRCRFYAAEICLAIGYLHSLDIIYRDLKPENLLLDTEGHVKITDFGLSKDGINDSFSGHTACGTPEYAAPEILDKHGHGKPVDWYSFGCLVYEMLTGLPPFYTRDREKLFERIRKGNLECPSYISPAAKSLLQGLICRDPGMRLGGRAETAYYSTSAIFTESGVASAKDFVNNLNKLKNYSASQGTEPEQQQGKQSNDTHMRKPTDSRQRAEAEDDIEVPHDIPGDSRNVQFEDNSGDVISFSLYQNCIHKFVNHHPQCTIHQIAAEPILGWGWLLEDQNKELISMPSEHWQAFNTLAKAGGLELEASDADVALADSPITLQDQPDSPEHEAIVGKAFWHKIEIPNVENRAISLGQLQNVIRYARICCPGWTDTSSVSRTFGQRLSMNCMNLHHVNTWIIRPATRGASCSFVELVAEGPQRPHWFVSHWWGERIVDFLKCFTKHAAVRFLDKNTLWSTLYWICAYANRQHNLGTDVTTNPKESSFFKAMQCAVGVCLVLNDAVNHDGPAVAFQRVWCVFEEALAVEHLPNCKLDIAACHHGKAELLTDGVTEVDVQVEESTGGEGSTAKARREVGFPLDVISAGLTVKIEDANASQSEDKVHILNCLAERDLHIEPVLAEHANYTRINNKLRALFAQASWRQALDKDKVSLFGLPDILSADGSMNKLSLNLRASPKCDSMALQDIARGLPQSLKFLELDASCCRSLGDDGIQALAGALPSLIALRSLRLHFQSCQKISSLGLASLAGKFPCSLKELVINAGDCRQVSDDCIIRLVQNLPSALHSLSLNLENCSSVSGKSIQALPKSISSTLAILQLNLRCTGIDNSYINELRRQLPDSIKQLRLNQFGTWRSYEMTIESKGLVSGYVCGALEIQNHAFFSGVDWTDVYDKKLTPPFKPSLHGSDVEYFEKEFTDQPAGHSEVADKRDVQHFEGYTYAGR